MHPAEMIWITGPALRSIPILPFVVAVLAVIVYVVPQTRKYALHVWFVPLCAVALGSAMLFGPLLCGAGLFWIVGWRWGTIIGCPIGVIAGAAAGVVLARTAVSRGRIFILIITLVVLYAYFIPLGLFEDHLGGGSGYGSSVPRWFIKLFEAAYLPWMGNAGKKTGYMIAMFYVLPIVFWLVVGWCGVVALRRRWKNRRTMRST